MIRVLYLLLSLGTTILYASQPGGSMPGASGMDSGEDGIDNASGAIPNGPGKANPGAPRQPNQASGVNDFNPSDPAGAMEPLSPNNDEFPVPGNANPERPMPMAGTMPQPGPHQIGRNAYDPNITRGAHQDTTPESNIPNFKQLPADKQQQKLRGMENIRALQNSLLEGDKTNLCGENGICRRNFGEGCTTSKNFLSVCSTMCSDNGEFRGSHCIVNGAKRYKMNPMTFVYEPRPDKQKKAESTIDHIIIQLREGRKALRSDKRLFFNTFCTPPSINMIPGDANRRRIAEACAYFLYNGFPPPGVLDQILIGQPTSSQPYVPPPPPMVGPQQPQMPMMPPPMAAAGPDDINAPVGGLPEAPNAAGDKGAVYTGPGTPIVEDKESLPHKKGKKGKKHKKKKAKAAPVADDTSAADDSTAQPAADDSAAQPAADDSTAPVPPPAPVAAPAPPPAPVAAPAPPPAPVAAPAPPPQQNEAMGAFGNIQGLMGKFGKKGGQQPAQGGDQSADPNAAPDQSGGSAPAGGQMPSAMSKFMKF